MTFKTQHGNCKMNKNFDVTNDVFYNDINFNVAQIKTRSKQTEYEHVFNAVIKKLAKFLFNK